MKVKDLSYVVSKCPVSNECTSVHEFTLDLYLRSSSMFLVMTKIDVLKYVLRTRSCPICKRELIYVTLKIACKYCAGLYLVGDVVKANLPK